MPLPAMDVETGMLTGVAAALGIDRDSFFAYWLEYLPEREEGKQGSLADNFEHACRKLGAAPLPELIAQAVEIKERQVRIYLSAPPESEVSLKAVRAASVPIGLISNGPPETPGVWPTMALAQYVDHPVFSAAVGMLKPDPKVYLHTCALLGVAPERCLYVGDGGNSELTGASRVGMDAVLVRGSAQHGGFYANQIDDAHRWPGRAVDSVAEVPRMLED